MTETATSRGRSKPGTLGNPMKLPSRPPRVIKKYGNRRLYDSTDSAYITLDELAQRVRSGIDVRVIDAASGDDLTQQTLTQLLFEGRGAAKFLSASLLTQLVRLGDDALADFLGRYLSSTLEFYLQSRRGAQAIAPLNPFATLPFAATDALARLVNSLASWGSAGSARDAVRPSHESLVIEAPPVDAVAALSALREEQTQTERELASLRTELAALSAAIEKSPSHTQHDAVASSKKTVQKKSRL
ncbi:MAG: polyhydroxyalkanoate synthesis regulator DNA-binding domain-containing protein [Deltaproteobacteria bacterium]|nr:polyhydroxyalkanoate synthesis regulator DNA-binding domain-containing protein [Deltaproteobacteria bacterium]